MPGKPRVLIPVTYGLSVRYFVSTGLLEQLSRVCTPVVAIGWDDPALSRELSSRGYETVQLPSARLNASFQRFQRRCDLVHQKRLDSPSTAIKLERRRRRAPRSLRHWGHRTLRATRDRAGSLLLSDESRLEAELDTRVAESTNADEFGRLLDRLSIEAVLSATPYHTQDGLLLWCARSTELPSLTSIISFDNPTIRGRTLARSPVLTVWNQENAQQTYRAYGDVSPEDVKVVGAPQFDLHSRRELLLPEDEWRKMLGLDRDRPVILYGAGPGSLVRREPDLVALLDDQISRGDMGKSPQLLVRCHPVDNPSTWSNISTRLKNGTVVDSWAPGHDPMRSWPTDDDIAVQLSTLAYAAVHINICSSMTIDGAAFDRPQIGPRFVPGSTAEEALIVRDFYRQEHWNPIARSGGLAVADSAQELASQTRDALVCPESRRNGRRRLLQNVLTYTDGRASGRLVDEVAALVS